MRLVRVTGVSVERQGFVNDPAARVSGLELPNDMLKPPLTGPVVDFC